MRKHPEGDVTQMMKQEYQTKLEPVEKESKIRVNLLILQEISF